MKTKIISIAIGILIGIPITVHAIDKQKEQKKPIKQFQVQNCETEVFVMNTEDEILSANTPVEVVKEERTYFDVPIDHELQDFIIDTCKSYNIAPAIVVAMIEKESTYAPNRVGDDGCSMGLMQVQEKWHKDRMKKLGCTDLMDPYQNVLVAVDFLAELASENEEIMWVLMAYNGGRAYATRHMDNPTEYAIYITDRAEELERGFENQ